MEQRAGGKNGCDLLKIILMIRSEINLALGLQCLVRQDRKAFIDEPMAAMLSFGPRVGKINVNRHG